MIGFSARRSHVWLALRLAVLASLIPAAVFAARPPALVPEPRFQSLARGEARMDRSWTVRCERGSEDSAAVETLIDELHRAYGWRPGAGPSARVIELVVRASSPDSLTRLQGYDLEITPDRITIAAESAAGRYYGVQTLRQIVRTTPSASLPCQVIRDSPNIGVRGVSEDISRGQLPTLATLLSTVRELGYYKVNQYHLYIEDVFDFEVLRGTRPPRDFLTADELRLVTREGARHHVTVVPVLQTLGHQERLLAEPRFQHLAEIRRSAFDRMLSGVRTWLASIQKKTNGVLASADAIPTAMDQPPSSLCPTDPEVRRMMSRMVTEISRSSSAPFLHCGGDEPLQVGQGRSRDAVRRDGLGAVYSDYYVDLNRTVRASQRRMMLYGDVILAHPTAARRIPKEVVVVDWHYDPEYRFASLDTLQRAGFTALAMSGMWNWYAFHPDYRRAFANIRGAVRGVERHGSSGVLVSSWGDGGAECLNASNWAGYAYLAACAWTGPPRDDPEFLEQYARTAFGEAGRQLGEVERRLGWIDLGGRPWPGRVFHRPLTIRPRTAGWRASLDSTSRSMRRVLALLDAVPTALDPIKLNAARLAAERYQLLADRELLLDEVARTLRAHGGSLPSPVRSDVAERLRESGRRTRKLAADYRALWLECNRLEGIAFNVDRLIRQAEVLEEFARRANDGTLEEWRTAAEREI
jgi:Glycosyl hydrolase family 20, domain 2/Glycosyl hydrolase family 20, catalytic domain